MKKIAYMLPMAIAALCLLPLLAAGQKIDKQEVKKDSITGKAYIERVITTKEFLQDSGTLVAKRARIREKIADLRVQDSLVGVNLKQLRDLNKNKENGGKRQPEPSPKPRGQNPATKPKNKN